MYCIKNIFGGKLNSVLFCAITIAIILSNFVASSQRVDSVGIQELFSSAYRHMAQGNIDQAELLVDSILNFHEQTLFYQSDIAADVLNLGFAIKSMQDNPKGARKVWSNGIKIFQSMNPADVESTARLYMSYAAKFNKDIETDSILAYLDPAEAMLSHVEGPSYAFLQLYYQKARLAFGYSDYEGQLAYAKKGLLHQETYFPDNNLVRISLTNSIGIGSRRLRKFNEAAKYFNMGLATPATNRNEEAMHAAIYNNLGLVYADLMLYDSCVLCIKTALDYYISHGKTSDIGTGYVNLGDCLKASGQLKKAHRYYNQSLRYMQENYESNHRDFIISFLALGRMKMDQQDLDSAQIYFTAAKKVLINNGWQREDPGGKYILDDPFRVFTHLIKLNHYRYQQSRDTSYLVKAISNMEDFIATTDYAFQQYISTTSIEEYFIEFEQTYSMALDCLYELNLLSPSVSNTLKAVEWIEKFKAMELRCAFRRSEAKFSPAHELLNLQHKKLLEALHTYEQMSYETAEPVDSVQQLIIQTKIDIQQWKQEVLASDPAYYALIFQNDLPAYDFSKLLARNQSALLFKLGEDCVYAIVADHDTCQFNRISMPDSTINIINDFRQSFEKYGLMAKYDDYMSISLLNDYVQDGIWLYRKLIQPIRTQLKEQVLIIPDGFLNFLPFASLLTESVGEIKRIKDYPFFIRKHAVGYSYSLALYAEMKNKNVSPEKRALSIAPHYGAPSIFKELRYNELEAKAISDFFHGTLLVGDQATCGQFISRCPQYRVIHLAAHAKSNGLLGEPAYLAYTQDTSNASKLYIGDIYKLSLQAELVSLSACESGLGKWKVGEGIISLARAFSFAGAKSVISTLWGVNDKSTSAVMTEFYSQLREGKTKDSALQSATIDYIESSTQAEAHPYYWSGFLAIGDLTAITTSESSHGIWPYMLIIIFILVISIFLKKSTI
jgi:CHAT domain-containing protein